MSALAPLAAVLLAAAAPADDGAPAGEAPAAPGLIVETAGQCPTEDAVMAALRPVLGEEVMRATKGTTRVSDLGDRFEVIALGQTRQYTDTARDCAERARVAAVFITLAVNPPMFATPPPPPPPPRVVEVIPRTPTPVGPTAPPIWMRLGVAARIDGGRGSELDAVASGVEARVAIGRGPLGGLVTAAFLLPTESRLSSVVVHQQRNPCSIGVVGRRMLAGIEGAVSLGVAVVPFFMHADGLAQPQRSWRVDGGARLAVELRLLRSWLSPFAGVHAEYFPRTYAVAVDPLGNIATTERFWAGGVIGLSFDPRPSGSASPAAERSDRR